MIRVNLLRHVAVVVMMAALAGCNGDEDNCSTNPSAAGCPPPPTTQPPCTQSNLFQSGTPTPPLSAVYAPTVTTTSAGRLDLTVDWTFATSPVGFWVVRPPCGIDQLNARTCDFVVRSEPATTPKPRRASSASGLAAGTYQLIVGNLGNQNESVSAQIILSSASCPAVTSAGVGASRTREAEGDFVSARTW
jgi:hypothetical protein